ncbi:hypothetical protein CYMTET_13192 [Cymbomonas tetramitiformis]|uniref:Phytocyanin domain-containing protein n=1 Tax=Cymbomonas tetramitiformis TaxID=36881 RepID=A0AAE0GJ00_9CHLO|nr:hypothetical protein CYMTET_13192 [Cymbomonas tetramitiformis]
MPCHNAWVASWYMYATAVALSSLASGVREIGTSSVYSSSHQGHDHGYHDHNHGVEDEVSTLNGVFEDAVPNDVSWLGPKRRLTAEESCEGTEGVTHEITWQIPMDPQEIQVKVCDTLALSWSDNHDGHAHAHDYAGNHDVWSSFDSQLFDNCDKANATEEASLAVNSVNIKITEVKDFYLMCSIAGHCQAGQKLKIVVTQLGPFNVMSFHSLDLCGVVFVNFALCELPFMSSIVAFYDTCHASCLSALGEHLFFLVSSI